MLSISGVIEVKCDKSLVLSQGNEELFLKVIVDMSVLKDECFQRPGDLDKLVNGFSCVTIVQEDI